MNIKNNVTLIGRIGNQIELKSNQDFIFLNFSIAIDDSYFNKETQEKVERTQWINCVAKGKTAEHISKFYAKGNQIAINGKLTSRKFENESGKSVFITEVEIETADITLRVQAKRED